LEDTIAREISNAEVLARHEDTMREKRKIREGAWVCVVHHKYLWTVII
jgi:hypothetical protein